MTSKVLNKKKTTVSNRTIYATQKTKKTAQIEVMQWPLSEIERSPFNRVIVQDQSLLELAEDIKLHDIINALTVRRLPSGKVQLIAGERRYQAALLAGKKEVPVCFKQRTDAQVVELQLSENLHRENPHPYHEAQQIKNMLAIHKSTKEIALRLSKPVSFIYTRLKLLDLIPALQNIFLLNKLSFVDALQLAALASDAQEHFFSNYCTNWEEPHFKLSRLADILAAYTFDLHKAPFDTTRKDLLPDKGACGRCKFNSAVMQSLFPGEAKQSICKNAACFTSKSTAHYTEIINGLLKDQQIDAIITNSTIPTAIQEAINSVEQLQGLSVMDSYSVNIIYPPAPVKRENYPDQTEEGETAYEAAQLMYEEALQEYAQMQASPESKTGLRIINQSSISLVCFTPFSTRSAHRTGVTAAQVQQAIKDNTATPAMLQGEIDRTANREKRAKELDREKVQAELHTAFSETILSAKGLTEPTPPDMAALAFLLCKGVPYTHRHLAEKIMSGAKSATSKKKADDEYNELLQVTPKQLGQLIRLALAAQSESKTHPTSTPGILLYKMAETIGVNVSAIEKSQQEKTDVRAKKVAEKKGVLTKLLHKLQKKQPKPKLAIAAA